MKNERRISLNPVNSYEVKHQEHLQRLRDFTLKDDIFFSKCMHKQSACMALILKIILEDPSICVKDVSSQEDIYNLTSRSIRLDVLTQTDDQRMINVEIQRSKEGANVKRIRFHASMLDVNELEKGQNFKDIPDSYVIFIIDYDIFGEGLPIYHIDRGIKETKKPFNDGVHLIYVNSSIQDDTPLGRLMHDFACKDPDDMYYEVLAERVRFFKSSKEGVDSMCEILEQMRDQYVAEGFQLGQVKGEAQKQMEFVQALLLEGSFSLEKIAFITGMPLDDVIQLEKSMN